MACCCGSGGGSTTSLPILTGSGAPVTPPDLSTHLPLYRDVTTGEMYVWAGGIWSLTRAPVGWMIKSSAPLPLQSTDFITINRGGTPGNPDGGTYYVATIQDLATTVGSIVGATVVQSGDAAIGVSASGSTYTVTFEPQGGAAEIAGDATALSTLFGAATLGLLSDVSSSIPNVNDALVWNGSQWTPVPLSALTNDSFVNGGSITGGGTTLTLTYNTAALPPVNINVANIIPNYDNTSSGLSSTNMQAAIDELAAMFGGAFTNIGTGQPIYAGFSGGAHQLRSIDGANGISASIQGNTIVLQFDPGSLTPVALQQLASMLAGDSTAMSTLAGAISLGDLADVNTSGASNGEVLMYNGGTWVPGTVSSGGGVEEVLQGICAECFDDALAQGLSAGDYFLHIGTNPPTLFHYDGSNLNAVNPLPDIFVCCNSLDVWVQCNGQLTGTMAVGDELAHMVMNVFCANSQAQAIALGLQAHQYWLDVSSTPPQLMHYNGVSSTPAPFTPRQVNCCNSGDIYIRCQSGAGTDLVHYGNVGGGGTTPATDVTVAACPSGPVNSNTTAQDAICTLSNAVSSIAASDISVPACPNGPISSPTTLDNALCSLSAGIGARSYFSFYNGSIVDSKNISAVTLVVSGSVNLNVVVSFSQPMTSVRFSPSRRVVLGVLGHEQLVDGGTGNGPITSAVNNTISFGGWNMWGATASGLQVTARVFGVGKPSGPFADANGYHIFRSPVVLPTLQSIVGFFF